MKVITLFNILLAIVASAACAPVAAQEQVNPFARIGHIVVIFTENRSFDHVFGLFPGAEGINSAQHPPQVDFEGRPLAALPRPRADDRFPRRLPNAPFRLEPYVDIDGHTMDPVHDFYLEREQIDGGKMDRFVEASNAGALVMGYYDGSNLKQWALAKEFTLADHFFHAAFGGSMLNHFFLICGCAPAFDNPVESTRKKFLSKLTSIKDSQGADLMIRDRKEDSPRSVLDGPPRHKNLGPLTMELEAIGTLQPGNPVSKLDKTEPQERLPPLHMPTIGDRLTEKGVTWAWYAGGWRDVVEGRLKPYGEGKPDFFQTHHQPFAYFANYAEGQKGRDHLKDADDFFFAMDKGDLPQVSFYKPLGVFNGHPDYSDLAAGDAHVAAVIERLRKSPNWADMLIIVTADENGGFWDHVAPPERDAYGPGARVPTLIISPFAKKGFVDKTVYDTLSILRTIELRFGVTPLSDRDTKATDLRNALIAP
ncbi:MAG: acid phosphatase [Alphaproteobacteria bacterium]|nr:acid phosphatase [Alphaproteobacteria bacterium]MBM3641613.1 acid phosphatase [Alphaproteobacteria bacterium]